MVDFAGWEMPLLYTGIVEEHHHTRRAASLFDVSHMGRVEFRGPAALDLLQQVCTRQLGDAAVGQSRYSQVCNEAGGILDDVIISRYEDHWLMVCNASNRQKILGWLQRHAQGRAVEITDTTHETVMVALQGPRAVEILSEKAPVPIAELRRYRFLTGSVGGQRFSVFRSGYTGEDGVEAILPAEWAEQIDGFLDMDGAEGCIRPAGLGARDTLRMEAAMPLYGHELGEQMDPISAGLGWSVDLKKDFIGAVALRDIARLGPQRKLVGLELEGRRIARQHSTVFSGEQSVGEVTSGTFSPTLQKSVAMAYVDTAHAGAAVSLAIDIGGQRVGARVVPLPFYKRS